MMHTMPCKERATKQKEWEKHEAAQGSASLAAQGLSQGPTEIRNRRRKIKMIHDYPCRDESVKSYQRCLQNTGNKLKQRQFRAKKIDNTDLQKDEDATNGVFTLCKSKDFEEQHDKLLTKLKLLT